MSSVGESMPRRFVSTLLVIALLLSGCTSGAPRVEGSETDASQQESAEVLSGDYSDPSDNRYLASVESAQYSDLVNEFSNQGYYIEKIEAIYVSQEYLNEIAYNSQSNIYFGYTLAELEEQFVEGGYVFTVDENGTTVVQQFKDYNNVYGEVVKDLAFGGGVILLCVTVSAVTGGTAPAISMIFASAASSAVRGALAGSAVSGLTAAFATGIETGDFEEAVNAGITAAGEGFKWGAIGGALGGGVSEGVGLRGAARNGLTMNEAALIQRESKMPLDVIGALQSMDQYQILKDAGVYVSDTPIAGRTALIRHIDLNQTDELGVTNLQKMKNGAAPLDPDGTPYELHHVGQQNDGTLAILTRAEHRAKGNHSIWHRLNESDVDHGYEWTRTKKEFWMTMADLAESGAI